MDIAIQKNPEETFNSWLWFGPTSDIRGMNQNMEDLSQSVIPKYLHKEKYFFTILCILKHFLDSNDFPFN